MTDDWQLDNITIVRFEEALLLDLDIVVELGMQMRQDQVDGFQRRGTKVRQGCGCVLKSGASDTALSFSQSVSQSVLLSQRSIWFVSVSLLLGLCGSLRCCLYGPYLCSVCVSAVGSNCYVVSSSVPFFAGSLRSSPSLSSPHSKPSPHFFFFLLLHLPRLRPTALATTTS